MRWHTSSKPEDEIADPPEFTIGCLSASVQALSRSAASRRKDQFFKERGYCITSVACQAAHFRLVPALRLSPNLLAIDTNVAFTIASLRLGIGQGHRHGSGGVNMVIR
jgi:hypothetical protein